MLLSMNEADKEMAENQRVESPTLVGLTELEVIDRGKMRYELAIITRGVEYVGSWRCPACNRGDASPVRYPNSASVRLWANHCVDIHHAKFHEDNNAVNSKR
jgi:hypothetical protein